MSVTDFEAGALGEVSRDLLWQHTETLAGWQRIAGSPGERAGVEYLRQRLEEYGLQTATYELDSLLSWDEDAVLELRSPERRSIPAITQSFAASTAEEGIEGEVVYLGGGAEADFEGAAIAGKIAIMEGIASPVPVLLSQTHGAIGAVFVSTDEHVRNMCASPIWGTPTPRTADLLPKIPVVSIAASAGSELRALLDKGPVRVWFRARTFLGWRKVLLLMGDLRGTVEPEKFVLVSGHHCSFHYGAMDNGAANATMLEVARVLATHRGDLRRSVRFAFWPGHSQGRYSGSTWYADRFWEDLHDNCVLHINVDSTGARGAELYESLCMADNRHFAVAAIRDVTNVEPDVNRMPRAGDQSFWGCGISSMFMTLSKVPPEVAAKQDSSKIFSPKEQAPAERKGGLPWWWHTPDDTLDKIDPEVLQRDTRVYLLATLRSALVPILPMRYGPLAAEVRQALERYQAAASDRFDLGPVIDRASRVEAATNALDKLVDRVRRRPNLEALAGAANRGLLAIGRTLVMLDFTAAGPFDHDLQVPIPAVAMLEPATRLAKMDPDAADTRYLLTELTRNRNRVAFYLQQALEEAEETAAALREVAG